MFIARAFSRYLAISFLVDNKSVVLFQLGLAAFSNPRRISSTKLEDCTVVSDDGAHWLGVTPGPHAHADIVLELLLFFTISVCCFYLSFRGTSLAPSAVSLPAKTAGKGSACPYLFPNT